MRIILDRDCCQGHNRCRLIAPELFDSDEIGHSVLLVEGEVPTALHDKARLAAANCPEFAIRIEDDPTDG